MRTLLGITALLASLAASAETVTVDFEEFTDNYQIINSFASKGYRFRANSGTSTIIHEHGSTMDYGWSNYGSTSDGAVITREDGNSFSLVSFDARNFEVGDGNLYTDFLAIGTRAADGSQVSFQFDANEGWVTYAPGDFDGLSSLAFYTPAQQDGVVAGFHMDNIVLTAVPVPAAAWLFGSALAGLGLAGRRRQARSS